MIFTFANMNQFENLSHGITSMTLGEIENFNIADHVGDNAESGIKNRKLACEYLGLNPAKLTTCQQVHKTGVSIITAENAGKGSDGWTTALPETDAMITNQPDTPLMVISADCPLILLYSPDSRVLGVVHASWRCTFAGIITKTIKMMNEQLGVDPKTIQAGIGPGAGPCCYEVNEDFVNTISARPELLPFVLTRGQQKIFDLFKAIESELISTKVPKDQIETMGICTICSRQFFSFRRQNKAAGRFALIAALS